MTATGLPSLTLAGRELSPEVYRRAVLNLSRLVSVLRKGKFSIIQAHKSAVMVKIIQWSLKKPQTLAVDIKTSDLSSRFKENPLLQRDKLYSGLTQTFFLHILPSSHLILWEVKNSGKNAVGWKTWGLGIQWRVVRVIPEPSLLREGKNHVWSRDVLPTSLTLPSHCQKLSYSSSSSSSSHLLSPHFRAKR